MHADITLRFAAAFAGAVRVFESAARHLSFTKAAAELGMTQAAVSYQIKVLEERVGVPLFLRQPRQVALTEAGQRFAPQVSEAFALIGEAYADGPQRRRGHAGHQHAPDLRLELAGAPPRLVPDASNPRWRCGCDDRGRMVDFSREEVDVGIRSGGGNWPGLVRHTLFRAALHADAFAEAARRASAA